MACIYTSCYSIDEKWGIIRISDLFWMSIRFYIIVYFINHLWSAVTRLTSYSTVLGSRVWDLTWDQQGGPLSRAGIWQNLFDTQMGEQNILFIVNVYLKILNGLRIPFLPPRIWFLSLRRQTRAGPWDVTLGILAFAGTDAKGSLQQSPTDLCPDTRHSQSPSTLPKSGLQSWEKVACLITCLSSPTFVSQWDLHFVNLNSKGLNKGRVSF